MVAIARLGSGKPISREAAEQAAQRVPPSAGGDRADDSGSQDPVADDTGPNEGCSYEAEVLAIHARYGPAIEAARRLNLPRDQIAVIVRGLLEQQANELAGVRERRKAMASRRPSRIIRPNVRRAAGRG